MSNIKIVVLSLTDSPRRNTLSNRLKNLNYEIFNAYSPNGYVDECVFNEELAFINYGRKLSLGEIGCSVSHKNIIKSFINESDSEWLIVLEDDFLPENCFEGFVVNIAEEKINNSTILLLGHSKTEKKTLFLQRLKQPLLEPYEIGGVKFGKNNKINLCGTVGYAINKSAARTIAECNFNFWLADDWSRCLNVGINVLHPFVPLLYEDLSQVSSIGNDIVSLHSFRYKPFNQILEVIISRARLIRRKIIKK